MQAFSVDYTFKQSLLVPAREAFNWATDYQPTDLALMGEEGTRSIQRITDDTIVLKEVISHNGRKVTKLKLVRLNPRNLSWHNIHLQGPNKHSEFLYQVTPEGKHRSRLTFTGRVVVYSENRLSAQKLRQIANREKKYDSEAWRRLAKAMASDHDTNKQRSSGY